MKIDSDSPKIKIPPPIIAMTFIVLGLILQQVYALPWLHIPYQTVVAWLVVALGLGIILYCSKLFKRAHTNIEPWKTTSAIVTTGIYAYSRNPIYTAFVIIAVGAAIGSNSGWILLLQIPFIVIISSYVIKREEVYLEGKFGDEYRNYKQKVRRWI